MSKDEDRVRASLVFNERARTVLLVALCIACVALPPIVGGSFVLTLANTAAITAIAAMGLTVLTGTAGLLSLGQAAFVGIGAFSSALLVKYTGAGLLTCMLVAGACAAFLGATVAAVTLRSAGIYLAVGTLALQYVVELLLSDVEVKLTSALGFSMPAPSVLGWTIVTERDWWFLLCIVVAICWIILRWIVRGQVGRNWICVRENAAVASSIGISLLKARTSAFALASFWAGAAGALHGFYIGTVQITNYSLHLSVVYLTVVVLGGAGRLGGTLWAAALVIGLPHALSGLLRALQVDVISRGAGAENIILGIVLALVLLKVPERMLRLVRAKAS